MFSKLVGGAGILLLAFSLARLAMCGTQWKAAVGKPAVRLTNPVAIDVSELTLCRTAVLPDNESIVVVGTSDVREDHDPVEAAPGGVIVNLRTKAVRRFTNDHTARLSSVACTADGTRIVTGSTGKDKHIRFWDIKADKPLRPLDLTTCNISLHIQLACFHRSNRLAVTFLDHVSIFDPAKESGRIDLTDKSLTRERGSEDQPRDFLTGPPTTNDDDSLLACASGQSRVFVWDIRKKEVVYAPSLLPATINYHDWHIWRLCFTKSRTQLIACRCGNVDEVPRGTPEEKAPPYRRALFLIDAAKFEVTPLGIGHRGGTIGFALDPSEEWIATVGSSWTDEPDRKGDIHELRIFHYPTRALVHRIQFTDFNPSWVGFTPDGKKLIAVSYFGKVRCWDFAAAKP